MRVGRANLAGGALLLAGPVRRRQFRARTERACEPHSPLDAWARAAECVCVARALYRFQLAAAAAAEWPPRNSCAQSLCCRRRRRRRTHTTQSISHSAKVRRRRNQKSPRGGNKMLISRPHFHWLASPRRQPAKENNNLQPPKAKSLKSQKQVSALSWRAAAAAAQLSSAQLSSARLGSAGSITLAPTLNTGGRRPQSGRRSQKKGGQRGDGKHIKSELFALQASCVTV